MTDSISNQPKRALLPEAGITNSEPRTLMTDPLMIPFRLVLSLLAIVMAGQASANVEEQMRIPPLMEPDDLVYVSGGLIYALEGRPTPQAHASTLTETPDGLVAAWFGGTHEKNPDVGIWVSRMSDGQWGAPVEVVDGSEGEDKEYACWNPVLFAPTSGPLMLFYKVGPSPESWWGMLITSDDHGKTWSKPRKLGENSAIGHLLGPVKNKPIQLDSGLLICPSSAEDDDGWRVHFEISGDLGRTWEVVGPVQSGGFDAIQPSIVTYADGDMQALCRTREGVVAQSWSRDGGRTWTKLAPTFLPNPNAATDALDLADGRKLLVYNHADKDGPLVEEPDWFSNGRQVLNVAISYDGYEWQPTLTLELEKNRAGYSYPAVIQTSDGLVHITYTYRRESIKHVVLDPNHLF